MADRHPLVLDHGDGQIHELAVGDRLDLTGCHMIGVSSITSVSGATFGGTTNTADLDSTGTASFATLAVSGSTALSGTLSVSGTAVFNAGVSFVGGITYGGVTMPSSDGTANQVLTTNGTGTATWQDAGGGVSTLPDLTDVTLTGPTMGQYLRHNGVEWVNSYLDSYSIDELTDVTSAAEQVGDMLIWNGTKYVNQQPDIADMSDVTLAAPAAGQHLTYNGTAWVNTTVSDPALDDVTDVTITSPAADEYLRYNGSSWVNAAASAIAIDDLSDVTVTSPSDGDLLTYNASNSRFEAAAPASSGGGAAIGTIVSSLLTAAQMASEDATYYLCDGGSCAGTDYATVTGNATTPDLRGQFLRGLDTSGTVDPDGAGRTLGSSQADATAPNGLTLAIRTENSNSPWHERSDIISGSSPPNNNPSGAAITGDSETRPTNVAINFFIKVNR